MEKRNYKLQDIKDYIYEEYELVWDDYLVLDNDGMRRVRHIDFENDKLSVVAIMYKDGRKLLPRWIQATNEYISVSGLGKNTYDWQDFLAKRYNQEQGLNK